MFSFIIEPRRGKDGLGEFAHPPNQGNGTLLQGPEEQSPGGEEHHSQQREVPTGFP